MPTTLAEGQPAPDFTAETDKGETVSLKDFAGKHVVLYFYPKDDTPGCTTEACNFRDNFGILESEGAVVLGVSLDSVQSHQKFRDKFELPFTLLADPEHTVSDAYGVYGQKSFAGHDYMGVDRATFVIGPDGTLEQVWPKVKPDGHALEVLAWLKEHKAAKQDA
ncbi:MAG: thioredoxin-dependent thiol peroxidase [Dehalococcoidia bacterium]